MMKNISLSCLMPFVVVLVMSLSTTYAQDADSLEGTWNMTVSYEGKELPSWLEISHSGRNTLIGRFTYAMGSARPIAEVQQFDDVFYFSIPPQWEEGASDMEFRGKKEGEGLKGTMIYTDGKSYDWTATRAPILVVNDNPKWGKAQKLFNGKDLAGWNPEKENQWTITGGILTSAKAGVNLVTKEKFTDFKLQAEFRYPEGSNSGLYLRGRYEVQIADNKGAEASSILFGGVYGLLTPNQMVAKGAGEWQTYAITLIGRKVTIVANGKTIISEQNIPGMTGGALDNDEAAPGPIMIQGDHGPVEFRKLEIMPIAN
ncbi:3-keto-disaccharide hydrolase [Maribacter antarcticus]|uniref:3-keto-disaccharide hydrolase n=1 Tax=Maribacter antarcticus TaxID=505250 RepID=UPI00047C46E3|nr:DUF1080 domain-containing protein [Maribacter antarcticus]